MFRRTVTGLPSDPALPALAQTLDPGLMLPFLAQAAALPLDDTNGTTCCAAVLNHKPGQRCIIRYTLESEGDGSWPTAVIGKLYRRRRLAARIYSWFYALRNGVFNGTGPLRIPAPLLLLPDLGLVLQEYVEGADLRHALSSGSGNVPLSLSAQWLARLHASPPLAGLKMMSLEHELSKVDQWCQEITPYLSATTVGQFLLAQTILHRLASEMPPYTPVMIHKDFYYANILWDGQQIWVLDFDQLSIGDPALDLGHFLAHLENLAYRTTSQERSFTEPAACFIHSYLEDAAYVGAQHAAPLLARLPFYKAYTFLKLAATEVTRKGGDWQRLTGVLTDLACREVLTEPKTTSSAPA